MRRLRVVSGGIALVGIALPLAWASTFTAGTPVLVSSGPRGPLF